VTTTARPLDVDAVLAEASRRTDGLDDLGDQPSGSGLFVDGLTRFLDSLAAEARLNAVGEVIASERALLHTVNRLNYVNDRKRFPESPASGSCARSSSSASRAPAPRSSTTSLLRIPTAAHR
jgi:hypothetical protein